MSRRLTSLSRLTPRACLHVRPMHETPETSAETRANHSQREEVMPHSEEEHQPPDRRRDLMEPHRRPQRPHEASSPSIPKPIREGS